MRHMDEKTKIRCDQSLNALTRVYLIANYLHDQGKIDSDLWYSILDLKDENLKDLQIEYNIEYFEK